MKNIKIPIEIKVMLDKFGDGKSVNKTMKELLKDVDTPDELAEPLGHININMDDDVLEKLSRCRAFPFESYGSVIYRLLQNHQK